MICNLYYDILLYFNIRGFPTLQVSFGVLFKSQVVLSTYSILSWLNFPFQGFENVKVSPFASSDAEISPDNEDNQFEIIYKNMPYAMTYNNVRRLWR